jgi:hypothetical protein
MASFAFNGACPGYCTLASAVFIPTLFSFGGHWWYFFFPAYTRAPAFYMGMVIDMRATDIGFLLLWLRASSFSTLGQDISILFSILLFFGDDKYFRNLYDDVLTDPSLCATLRIVICTIMSLLQRGFEDGGIHIVMLLYGIC